MGREALFQVRLFSPRILKPGRRAEGRGRAREDKAPEIGKAPRVFLRASSRPAELCLFLNCTGTNGGCNSSIRVGGIPGDPGNRQSVKFRNEFDEIKREQS